MRSLALVAAVLYALAGCSERPVTEIVVVSDTDLVVPAQVDEIAITIEPPSGLATERRGPLAGEGMITLPATLGVVHRGGPLGPVRVVATALHGTEVVVTREAVLEFIQDRTVTLLLPLEAACRGIACDDGETCASGACRPVEVTRDELLPWDGTTPRLEAGMPCTTEICNRFDDDCDGTADEGFDLAADAEHCGACGHVCPTHPAGVPACIDGVCGIDCNTGFGDCDGDVRNGCEVALNTLTMCGDCGRPCDVPHGTPTCFTGTCEPVSCAPGWGDCSPGDDGCESPLDTPEHCGECGTPCAPAHATPSCAGGVCAIASCDPGWDDCDPGIEGCERSISTVDDCGACGAACGAIAHGAPACVAGRCDVGSCEPGWDDCNGGTTDGCETPLTTVADCGGCGVACALPHAGESCSTGACAITTCDPGWSDCDGIAANGCETSLETASDCGTCDVTCSGTTPLCSPTPTGGRACQSTCRASEMLCSASCVDPSTSLANCGGCDQPCAPAHATPVCSGGSCGIAACDPGWDDCNGMASDGCETPLDTLADCGACDAACAIPGASARCTGGRCLIETCATDLADCDGSPANGCETPIDTVAHCGTCSTACSFPSAIEACVSGECALAGCEPGAADCDGMVANGCETALGTVADCAACGDACDLPHASETCTAAGTCAIAACDAEFGDCNGVASDGCETSLRLPGTCGSCTARCPALDHATSTCATGTCALEGCEPLWGDCDGMESTGCEQSLQEVASCGACGVDCVVNNGGGAVPTCAGGVCAVMCPRADRADCNRLTTDGCETRTQSDPRNCGSCGHACAAGEACNNGVCGR